MIHVGDNSWNIRVLITDLQVEKTLRVKGDLHIGGVMLKLSKTEGEFLMRIIEQVPDFIDVIAMRKVQLVDVIFWNVLKLRDRKTHFFGKMEFSAQNPSRGWKKSLDMKNIEKEAAEKDHHHNFVYIFLLKITSQSPHACVGCLACFFLLPFNSLSICESLSSSRVSNDFFFFHFIFSSAATTTTISLCVVRARSLCGGKTHELEKIMLERRSCVGEEDCLALGERKLRHKKASAKAVDHSGALICVFVCDRVLIVSFCRQESCLLSSQPNIRHDDSIDRIWAAKL